MFDMADNYKFNSLGVSSYKSRFRIANTVLTFGVFFSVFLLTNTGLSYFTNEAFGGIMLITVRYIIQATQLVR